MTAGASPRVQGLLRLVRPTNVVVSYVGTVVGGLAAAASGLAIGVPTAVALGLAGASTALVTGAGNVLNDLGDQEGDRRNHPDRPLVTGEVSPRAARVLTVGLFLAGVAVAIPVAVHEVGVAVILAAAIAGLLAYERWGKARGLVGNVTVAALTGMVFLYGGAAVGDPLPVAPFAAMAFFATLSREVIKDLEDVAGDTDRTTVPKVHGPRAASRLAQGAVACALALSVVPLLSYLRLASVAGLAYAVVVLAADLTFVLSVARLPERPHFGQTVSKGAMTVALVAFLAVAFR